MSHLFPSLLFKSPLGSLAAIGAISSTLMLTACNKASNTQSTQVPPTVQSAFAAKYPGVTPSWESQPYGYEAIFQKNGIEYEAEFSKDGRWLETEYQVPENRFSALVINRVKKEYPGYKITKREIELTPRGTFYEVEVEGGGKQIERYYDERANPARNLNEDA